MKEVIVAEISTQPQRHAEKWETYIDHPDGFESWIYLNNVFPPGPVKITIESSELGENDENEMSYL